MHTFSYRHRCLVFLLIFIASNLVLTETIAAGNEKFMSIRKAKAVAQRALLESVMGLKIHSNELWTTSDDDNYRVLVESTATIRGVVFDAPKYDGTKDIAMINARIRLSDIKDIINKSIPYDDMIITRVGFATSSPQFQAQLQALRAAELSAYDEMAKLLVGQEISTKSEMKNFVLENDEIRTKTHAVLWGAEVSEFGWEKEGTAFIRLKLNAKWAKNILGSKTRQDVYEVIGYGAIHENNRLNVNEPGIEQTNDKNKLDMYHKM